MVQINEGPASELGGGEGECPVPCDLGKQGSGQESEEGVGVGKEDPIIPQVFSLLDFFYIQNIFFSKWITINIISFVIFFPSSRLYDKLTGKYFQPFNNKM